MNGIGCCSLSHALIKCMAVQAQPGCPQAWLRFLQHEESLAPPGRSPAAGSGMSGLCQLFAWATRVVPRQPHGASQAYQLLWIGLARHQWCARMAGDLPHGLAMC